MFESAYIEQCNSTDTELECETIFEKNCHAFKYQEVDPQISDAFAGQTWFLVFIFFSFAGLLWLAYVFWAYKELNVHPMRMFLYLSIFEAS